MCASSCGRAKTSAWSPSSASWSGTAIDNDVYPAKLLGMKTVLFRTGRHIDQQPRAPSDVPDAEVRSAEELRSALKAMLDAARER
jgi:FMN phosphatase YigB (HAD superfamily)